MSRTVTAFFDSRDEAEAAKTRLQSSSIDADRIRIIDQSSSSNDSNDSGSTGSSGENKGFFASLSDMFLPDDDAYAYQEGINRGGYLLTAQVEEGQADEAVRILDEANSVDFDSRESEWRGQGWGGYDRDSMDSQRMSATGTPNTAAAGTTQGGRVIDEEHIPIVEEQLHVGKRETQRGGARVRSYVRETPVHEQVTLRDEHVSVERRPVDQNLSAADLQSGDMMRDRTIEMTETHEEAMVDKEARVREEMVVRKTSEDRVEQIDDTVRRTEVEVDENLGDGSSDRSAFGSFERDNQGGMTGDRDRDGTPNALDTTDRTRPGGSREGGMTGDRDGDGTPNVLDTTDRTRR